METMLKVMLEAGDTLFSLVTFDRDMREGDLFTYESPVSPLATYKVESATMEFVAAQDTGIGDSGIVWNQPQLNVVVSVVV